MSGISRREFLRGGIALAGAASLGSLAAACGERVVSEEGTPEPLGPPFTGTLRVLGLPVDVNDLIRLAAERDLGFSVAFEATSAPAMVERVLSKPASFDIFSGYAYQTGQVWPAGNLVGLDRARIVNWAGVTDLYKLGKRAVGSPACTVGDGDAPFRTLYTTAVHEPGEIIQWGQDDGSGPRDGEPEPPAVTGAPSSFGFDSIGYRRDILVRDLEQVSWAELLNVSLRGRVALPNEPTAGLQAAALSAQALGLMTFEDTGDLTRPEIDGLARILLQLRGEGQFRAFWSTFDESVDLMAAEDVVVESLPEPAVSLLQSSGHPVSYAAPPEGYRGWAGSLSVSQAVLASPSKLQACYDYVNWWHSGIPGAILLRYGSYNAVPATILDFVSGDEWDYWIEGEPAASHLDSPFGQRSIKTGQVRDGGPLRHRACHIATWRSHFDEQSEHAAARWNEVVAA